MILSNNKDMKALLKSLLLVAVLSAVLHACKDEKPQEIRAVITFDSQSSKEIGPDNTFRVFGEITAPEGAVVESIIGSVVSKDYDGVSSAVFTTGVTDWLVKHADNHYTFNITDNTGNVLAYVAFMTDIKIDVIVKDGFGSTKSWAIKSSEEPGGFDFSLFTFPKTFAWELNLDLPGDSCGMDYFGLKWDDINPEGFIVILPRDENLISRFVQLDDMDDSTWTYSRDKKEFYKMIDEKEDLSTYEKIKVSGDTIVYSTSNILGLVYKDNPYALKIIRTRMAGKMLIIEGEFKEK